MSAQIDQLLPGSAAGKPKRAPAIDDLLRICSGYLPHEEVEQIYQAYLFAAEAHKGQVRLSHEDYITHPLSSATTLADLKMDPTTLKAALLHDVPWDTSIPLATLEKRFGKDVARLVDGATKLNRLAVSDSDEHSHPPGTGTVDNRAWAEGLRKMFIAMAEDSRVLLVKLAERLNNMESLAYLPEENRRQIANETLDIYAPLAGRLGIGQLKWQLEDWSFHYLDPEKYKEIATLLASRREAREEYVAEVTHRLSDAIGKAGIVGEVTGRPKHIYSIYRKMEERGVGFDQIYDLAAVRVIVEKKPECYLVLGVAHCLWPPIAGQFDDYIALPKASGYRSLHTAVMGPEGKPIEIQIRTREMHKAAEFGVAAHWRYKDGEKRDLKLEQRVAWLRHLLDWQREMAGAQDFVESLKTDIFADQVYVFTPKGEIRELPAGSTPLDFAYQIHSDIGHRCIAAMVNRKPVALEYRLQNGDQVEIFTSPEARGPSPEWLDPGLKLVRTTRARTAIRQYLRRLQRDENVARGREQMDAEMSRLGLPEATLDHAAEMLEYQSAEDLLAAVGIGEVSSQDVATGLVSGELPKKGIEPTEIGVSVSLVRGMEVLGSGEQINRLARCCNPVPGEPIAGYLTLGKGITVHRLDCPNLMGGSGDRIVPVRWGPMESNQFPVALRLDADDLEGVLRDVAMILAEEPATMTSVNAEIRPNGCATVRISMNVSGAAELGQLLTRLEQATGVQKVVREAS